MNGFVHHICNSRGHYIPSQTVETFHCGCERQAARCPFDGGLATGLVVCSACRHDVNSGRVTEVAS